MSSLSVDDFPLPTYPQVEQRRSQHTNNKDIFIVHGHDDMARISLAYYLRTLELKPIILHEQANRGKTIIEKFEHHANLAGFAFVLLTPDDIGGGSMESLKPRARQNVILELGFFMGVLGRERVCCIHSRDVEIPSDILGVVYLPYHQKIEECFQDVRRELKDAGYSV
jgi:predicted nucleotide-binding protein